MTEDDARRWHPETLAVRAGYDPASGANAAKPPIYMTSTFAYASARQAKDIHQAYFDGTGPEVGHAAHIYSRLGHPNLDIEITEGTAGGRSSTASSAARSWASCRADRNRGNSRGRGG